MKKTILSLLTLALLCGAAIADCQTDPCSLNVQMVDWIELPGGHFGYGTSDWGAPYGDWFAWSGLVGSDLAMGDSVLVWLPGNQRVLYVDIFNTSYIDTSYCPLYGSERVYNADFQDSIIFLSGGGYIWDVVYTGDSTIGLYALLVPFADFHYAVLEDTFLYTVDFENNEYTCVNVADPESIFVYRTFESWYPIAGLEVINGYVYAGCPTVSWIELDPYYGIGYFRPGWNLKKIDMLGGDSATFDTSLIMDNRYGGDLTSSDSLVFYINTELANGPQPYIGDTIGYEVGYSRIGVFDRDYSFVFDSAMYFGELAFGIDIVREDWLAVGFEHGFSIVSIADLDSIHEIAYYRDTDSSMNFTQFALKDNRLYAIGHPIPPAMGSEYRGTSAVRLFLFELDTVSMNQITWEIPTNQPNLFELKHYPNPFNSTCKFVVNSGKVCPNTDLRIYDTLGRIVYRHEMDLIEGANIVQWRPDNLPSGLYFARLSVGDYMLTAKLVYAR